MIARRYEISLRVLKKYFPSERSERGKYFSKPAEKFRIFKRNYQIAMATSLVSRSVPRWRRDLRR